MRGAGQLAEKQTCDPFDELVRIQDRIDRLVGGLLAVTGMNMDMPDMDIGQQDGDIIVTVDLPRVEFWQQDGDTMMTADMPGVDEKEIDVDVLDERVLEITARKKIENAWEEEDGLSQRERRYMFYCRSIMLPAPIDKTKVKSSYNNGVLEISIPMAHKTMAGETAVS